MKLHKFLSAVTCLVLASPSAVFAQDSTDTAAISRMAEDPEVAFARAKSELDGKTQFMIETWWRDGADWAADLEKGMIEFRNERGWVISAPVQVVGTYNTLDGTFMWGWDHPSVPQGTSLAAKQVQEFGVRNKLEKLTTRLVELSEDEAWQLTSLADYLWGGNGAYRGPAGTTLVYMTFGEVSISKP